MKRFVLAGLLVLSALCRGYAQQVDSLVVAEIIKQPEDPMRRVYGTLWIGDTELSADTLQLLLSPKLFNDYNGARKQYVIGHALTNVGFLALGVSIVSITVSRLLPIPKGTDVASGTSIILMMFGSANLFVAVPLIPTGLIFKQIGKHGLNDVVIDYNTSAQKQSALTIAPTLMPVGQSVAVGMSMNIVF